MKKAINCINQNLLEIYKTSIEMSQLTDTVRHYLPDHLKCHIEVASYDKGLLILKALTNTAKTELRYLIPDMRTKMRKKKQLYQLVAIKIVA